MTEPKAWHCPNCCAYHAPHVDTCPKPKPAVNLGGQHSSYGQSMNTSQYQEMLRNAQQAQNIAAGQLLGDQRVGVSIGANFTGDQG